MYVPLCQFEQNSGENIYTGMLQQLQVPIRLLSLIATSCKYLQSVTMYAVTLHAQHT